jgi:hypothetical protein
MLVLFSNLNKVEEKVKFVRNEIEIYKQSTMMSGTKNAV